MANELWNTSRKQEAVDIYKTLIDQIPGDSTEDKISTLQNLIMKTLEVGDIEFAGECLTKLRKKKRLLFLVSAKSSFLWSVEKKTMRYGNDLWEHIPILIAPEIIEPFLVALQNAESPPKLSENAAYVLAGFRDPRACDAYRTILEGDWVPSRVPDMLIFNAIDMVAQLEDKEAIPALKRVLTQWWRNFFEPAMEVLNKLGWQPTSEEEKIYYWILQDDMLSLKTNWELTEKVLLSDLHELESQLEKFEGSNEQVHERAERLGHLIAVMIKVFLAIGYDETSPLLEKLVNKPPIIRKGALAIALLNSGNENLRSIGESLNKSYRDIIGSVSPIPHSCHDKINCRNSRICLCRGV